MKKLKIRIFSVLLALLLCLCSTLAVGAVAVPIGEEKSTASDVALGELPCKSAILMDAATGQVLFEQNPDEALPPASVTKIMTLLLVMEAIDSGKLALTDTVSVSEHAASMGGSQVYLKVGEEMSVEEMLKCVIIASANDCAVALAEHVAGSEEAFVAAMNARAAELGMKNTHFENTNGLDDTAENHVTSARDIALMSRELITHKKILEYSGIWMDTIRDGSFGLTNTNRLVRFYRGCTGLKTGSTARAKFCISATAERDGLSLICVVMAADTRDSRNDIAAQLLDFGFANFATYKGEAGSLEIPVIGGTAEKATLSYGTFCAIVPKGKTGNVTVANDLPECLEAPVLKGDTVGRVVYYLDGREIGSAPIIATEAIEKISFGTLFWRILEQFLLL